MPNSVHLHRVLAAKPDKVYRAFLEADALAKWLPPNGFACTVHQLDYRSRWGPALTRYGCWGGIDGKRAIKFSEVAPRPTPRRSARPWIPVRSRKSWGDYAHMLRTEKY